MENGVFESTALAQQESTATANITPTITFVVLSYTLSVDNV
jgi:hypothetical protein